MDPGWLRQNTDVEGGGIDRREEVANRRVATADRRQQIEDQRQAANDRRDEAFVTQKSAALAKAAQSEETERVLRDANEHLVIATVRAQTMTETAEHVTAQMSYMAEHDFLTGLPNRLILTDRLAQSISLAARHGDKVALMYLDLDHFKHINDSFGHAAGDMLLQSVARRLQACVRHSDTVCRQGGDEFVVLLTEVETAHDATVTANKLIQSMAAPHIIDGHRLHATLSIGISFYPDDGADLDALLRNADIAMYHAKKSGRNNYQLFTANMNELAVSRQSIETALHHALDNHEFVLHYQPKVNLQTGAIVGAEALVRLQQAHHRLVYPTRFISIAEECGLILPLGKWVLREACRQTAAWLHAGLDVGLMAVNVSAVEFQGKDFVAGLKTVLEETGLDPCHLELELTESGLMRDTELTTKTLNSIKNLGIQIAIDDFGTGYSGLSYLRRFPIDTLKIDQSFMSDINGDADNANLVSAIIAMGRSLKHRVVAEGVETQLQLDFLQSQGCGEGQGYYFSRPVSAEEFATLLVLSRH